MRPQAAKPVSAQRPRSQAPRGLGASSLAGGLAIGRMGPGGRRVPVLRTVSVEKDVETETQVLKEGSLNGSANGSHAQESPAPMYVNGNGHSDKVAPAAIAIGDLSNNGSVSNGAASTGAETAGLNGVATPGA